MLMDLTPLPRSTSPACARVILGLEADFGVGTRSTVAIDGRHQFSNPQRPWTDRGDWGLETDLVDDVRDLELAVIKLGDLNPGQTLRPAECNRFDYV